MRRGELLCENPACGKPIPESMWNDKDEDAEQEEMKRERKPHRPLFDSIRCMRAGTPYAYEGGTE